MRFPHWLAVGLVAVAAAGCGMFEKETSSRRSGSVTSSDGVDIVYDVRGKGDTALVFVHGWACDRKHWREQTSVFAEDYRVVTIDLPGHGESGINRESWSIAGLGADVATVVEDLDLDRVILVGHSMGGPVSLEAAPLLKGRVIGVIGVDTLHSAEMVFEKEMVEGMAAAFEADFAGSMHTSVPAMFPEDSDDELVEWVVERASATDPKGGIAIVRGFTAFDMKDALSGAGVPVRCINAAPRPPAGPATDIEVNRQYADFDAVLVDGAGHYLMLGKPDEFNARLREMIEVIESP